jgi:hypothetical protein
MPFALAGFIEVEQVKPGVYRVKSFSRNGQLMSEEISDLPEVAAANAAYGRDQSKEPAPEAATAPPRDKSDKPG